LTTLVAVLLFIYGTLMSSFATLVAQRLPAKQSILRPPSHCNACGTQLTPRDLIPVVGWLLNRGRCRTCGVRVSSRYPLFEMIGGSLWAATYLHLQDWTVVAWMVFWLFLVIVIQTDLLYMRVPDKLSLPGALVFLVLSILLKVQAPLMAVLGMVVNALLLLILALISRGKMGMGDVKLYASIGAMLGPYVGVLSLLLAAFAASIVGFGMQASGLVKRGQYIPFVPYIAIGTVVAAYWGTDIVNWYLHMALHSP